jgi:uncharacterized protein YcbK (DUF882 family)
LRHVKRITGLYDVSIVTHPAYEQTSVGTREAGNEIDKAIDRQVEKQNEQQRKAAEESTTDEEFEKMQQQQLEKMEQQLRDIRRNIAEIELDNDIY